MTDSFSKMELARKMDSLADTVACMQRTANRVTDTLHLVNSAVYEIVHGDGSYDQLRDMLHDLTMELGDITQCVEDAEDAKQVLTEEVERAASEVERDGSNPLPANGTGCVRA